MMSRDQPSVAMWCMASTRMYSVAVTLPSAGRNTGPVLRSNGARTSSSTYGRTSAAEMSVTGSGTRSGAGSTSWYGTPFSLG